MNSKKTPLRAFGQSSLVSSLFTSSSSNSARDDASDKELKKDSCPTVSLSDFLDRKLHKSSALSKTVQEKSKPFSSLVGSKEIEVSVRDEKEEKGEKIEIQDKLVFEQFKHTYEDKVDCVDTSNIYEEGTPNVDDELSNSKKRKKPYATVENEEHRTRKPFIVLGDDLKPKQAVRRDQCTANKKRKPLYNHYANGCGWWDCDMEGVDNEAVGYGEAWEGIGSTTLGGIDWH